MHLRATHAHTNFTNIYMHQNDLIKSQFMGLMNWNEASLSFACYKKVGAGNSAFLLLLLSSFLGCSLKNTNIYLHYRDAVIFFQKLFDLCYAIVARVSTAADLIFQHGSRRETTAFLLRESATVGSDCGS